MTADPLAFGPGHLGPDVDLLLDDCLPHERRDLALTHLAGCDVCRNEMDTARSLRGRLRALAEPLAVPAELTARLLAIGSGVASTAGSADSGEPSPFTSRPPAAGYLPVWRPSAASRGRSVVLAGGALSVAGLALVAGAAGAVGPSRVVRPLPGNAAVASPSVARSAPAASVLSVPVGLRARRQEADALVGSMALAGSAASASAAAPRPREEFRLSAVSVVGFDGRVVRQAGR